jgi:hypothetical protein
MLVARLCGRPVSKVSRRFSASVTTMASAVAPPPSDYEKLCQKLKDVSALEGEPMRSSHDHDVLVRRVHASICDWQGTLKESGVSHID